MPYPPNRGRPPRPPPPIPPLPEPPRPPCPPRPPRLLHLGFLRAMLSRSGVTACPTDSRLRIRTAAKEASLAITREYAVPSRLPGQIERQQRTRMALCSSGLISVV